VVAMAGRPERRRYRRKRRDERGRSGGVRRSCRIGRSGRHRGAPGDGGPTEGGSGTCVTAPGKRFSSMEPSGLMDGGSWRGSARRRRPSHGRALAKFMGPRALWRSTTIIETGRRPVTAVAANMLLAIDMSGYTGTTAEFGPYTNGFSRQQRSKRCFRHEHPSHGWLHLSWSYTGNHGTLSFTVNGMEYPTKNTGRQPTMASGRDCDVGRLAELRDRRLDGRNGRSSNLEGRENASTDSGQHEGRPGNPRAGARRVLSL